MFRTKRARIRAIALTGSLAAAAATIGAVSFNASAAETTPAAPVAPAAAAPITPANAVAPATSAIPSLIQPPAGSRPVGAYLVTSGTQDYTCVVPAGATSGAFTGASTPEAQLLGTGGRIHHFAGPSWQSTRDKSLVTATKVEASPRTGTIPELLLKVATHTGKGVLTKADYINRLYTSGGVAPTTACTAGQVVKVPYKALYVFWDAPAAPAA
ncbi:MULTISPECIES: DUF3455 domain-containing protein [Actinoplanes]|uniref:Tat pathway signal sequence domain protein n=2 Tax=Actinoplanes TaxID=1865 RepID=A0A0X3V7E7_9ACTN|nr:MULTISPECIES: DUF3455 domain-containing protein [Actinoplanes]KUL40347.1 hypothetical protein ADL15_07500 [Actinoplanes awajinensis subsp. mycoplanecinus]GIE66096.1 hypothetical protein Apa02nite_022040 [Actinoplanes palleronii]